MSVEDSQHTFSHSDSAPPSSAIRLTFRPTATLISSTRRFAGDVLSSVLRDPDSTSRIALVIHELLENTLKYSTDGHALLNVTVGDEVNGRRRVEVTARNKATPEQAEDLGRRIHALAAADDPMELYVGLMRESAQRSGSGLGLARIRVEGEMQLSCALEGDAVIVSACTAAE
jgi:anti-sigma regulatory factor (Ser/Thr protein kinase)